MDTKELILNMSYQLPYGKRTKRIKMKMKENFQSK